MSPVSKIYMHNDIWIISRSLEQNSQVNNPICMIISLLTNVPKQSNGTKKVFQQIVIEQLNTHMGKYTSTPSLHCT